MNLRLANLNDANKLAQLHEISSLKQPDGFMHKLGRPFLAEYYRTLLNNSSSVILCAIDDQDRIVGFVAGMLEAGARLPALRRNRLRLLIAALPALFRNPSLIGEVFSRQQSKDPEGAGRGYVVQSGAHEEFWAWLPDKTGGAIELHLKWLSIMRTSGAQLVRCEVDKLNDMVVRAHRMLGARIIKEFITPDGRQRLIFEYKLV